MGVCQNDNDHIIRQRRLTKKTKYKYNENQILLNNSVNDKNSKKFEKFKINEINCDNFYSINNNFNYSIIDSNNPNENNSRNEDSIDGVKLMNQPIENLKKENNNNQQNEFIYNDKYQQLLSHFNVSIEQFPYKRLSPYQIKAYENEYTSSKMISPYKFIEKKNYSLLFSKIYELCFLKCEPLLNNLNDDKKAMNLLFLKTVIILLSENYLDKAVQDISNLLIELSYENNNKYLNINNLYLIIKNYCEICYQIIFYFVIAHNQFTEEQYYEYLNNDNILIQDKYSNIDIDIFCLNVLFDNSKGNSKLDEITTEWSDYICGKKDDLEHFEEDNLKYKEKNIPNIKKKIIKMINPYNLLQILSGIKL